jgi:hypothetical protein
VPSLDLRFADNKSLVDAVTGALLVTFTRASDGTYVDSAGVLQTAATDVPRFDHTPTTGDSLGLLVEEQRTNGLLYSEDTSEWLAPVNITLSQNQTTAPDGALTADQYLETAATGLHAQDGSAFTFVTSTIYTYSVFVKSIGGRNFEIGYPSVRFTGRFARFNLSGSGSVQSSDAGVTASIQAYANGWYRCSATNTCASGASARIANFINNDSFARSYAGDVTKGLFIWGAQLEAGAFPTSYIPTTTAAVTRSADVASITGSAFSSWYRQDEGTVFVNFLAVEGPSEAVSYPFAISDNTINNRSTVFITGPSNVNYRIISSGTAFSPGANSAGSRANIRASIAGKIGTDQGIGCVNNTLSTSSSPSSMPTVDRMYIGANHSGLELSAVRIRRITYWPQRLANSTLQAVTQ